MRNLKYIGCCFGIIMLFSLKAWGQNSDPWKVIPTGSNHTIFIKASVNPIVDETPLESGDFIGVFYDSAGTGKLACGGYTYWSGENKFITAYGAEGLNPGFKQGERFIYKIWKSATACTINNVTVSYATGGLITHTNTFAENGISEVSKLSGVSSLIARDFDIQITNATCNAGGKILIRDINGVNVFNTEFVMQQIISGSITTSALPEIVDLAEGEYTLTLIQKGCPLKWPETFFISKDLNCNYPVISPNQDGVSEDYYIPFPGTAKIYDRIGILVREMTIPSTWDATDNSGRPLPMGTYIIMCRDQKEIMVTVVR
jgi:hypothetical protein